MRYLDITYLFRYFIKKFSLSYLGDVVLDNFNKASRDEDNILYQNYKTRLFWITLYENAY